MYDLIIIGAGPSGSAAGRIAGKKGLKILLIEKEIFPRYKPCGGGLSEQAMSYLDFKIPRAIIERDIFGARVHFRGRVVEQHKGYRIAVLTSRSVLDNFLLEKAKETGIQIKMGEKITDYQENDDYVEVFTNDNMYKSKFVIIAEGSHGKLKYKIRRKDEKDEYAVSIVAEIEEDTKAIDKYIHNAIDLHFGFLPVMLHSKACNLHGMSEEEMIKLGEDPHDPGGYFIINGTERVITTLEDLASNRIIVEFELRYGERIEVAKVFSQRRGYRALVVVERNKKDLLEVSFPSISGRINFTTMMRALGVETDEDIATAVSNNPEIMKFMLENLEEAEVETCEEALEKIGNRIAAGQLKEYQIKRANYIIDRYLLPHLGNEEEHRLLKAQFLGRMAETCFELALHRRNEVDKDHYANKRLKLAGDLMEDLFRVSFNRLTRDIKYQLERASMRNRELNISTVVRSDVLTERLNYSLATGNWVGGRTGVSQLLDRTDFIATLSHLRRVVSPLSRSQPHFEARDLHPTQWGRICPSETPEGPNCGLVKNFAQMVEISTGLDNRDAIKDLLFSTLDVQPLAPFLIEPKENPVSYAPELEAQEEEPTQGVELL